MDIFYFHVIFPEFYLPCSAMLVFPKMALPLDLFVAFTNIADVLGDMYPGCEGVEVDYAKD